MATMTNERHLPNLVINKIPDQATFQNMQNAGQINSDELYFVEGESISYSLDRYNGAIRLLNNNQTVSSVPIGTLIIGDFTYDGSTNVTIPVYDGSYT